MFARMRMGYCATILLMAAFGLFLITRTGGCQDQNGPIAPDSTSAPATQDSGASGIPIKLVLSELSFQNLQFTNSISNAKLTDVCIRKSKSDYKCDGVELTSRMAVSMSPDGFSKSLDLAMAKKIAESAKSKGKGVSIVQFLINDIGAISGKPKDAEAQKTEYLARVKYGTALGCRHIVVHIDPTSVPNIKAAEAEKVKTLLADLCAAANDPKNRDEKNGVDKVWILIEPTRGLSPGISIIKDLIKELRTSKSVDNIAMSLNLSAIADDSGNFWYSRDKDNKEIEDLQPYVKAIAVETYRFDMGKEVNRDYAAILARVLGHYISPPKQKEDNPKSGPMKPDPTKPSIPEKKPDMTVPEDPNKAKQPGKDVPMNKEKPDPTKPPIPEKKPDMTVPEDPNKAKQPGKDVPMNKEKPDPTKPPIPEKKPDMTVPEDPNKAKQPGKDVPMNKEKPDPTKPPIPEKKPDMTVPEDPNKAKQPGKEQKPNMGPVQFTGEVIIRYYGQDDYDEAIKQSMLLKDQITTTISARRAAPSGNGK